MIREAAVRVGAFLAYIVLYKICPRSVLGPGADYWDKVRYKSIRFVNLFIGWAIHTSRPIRESEFAGTLPMGPEEAERVLWEIGFERNPVAAVKTRNGTPEIGSWVCRDTPKARRQLHVMLFKNPSNDNMVDVYAHEEFSSLNPDVAVRHYRGVDQREDRGVRKVQQILPLEEHPE